ncbi:putative pectinesterase/pectinesterase inhibitor 26 [Populus nigra]|uniref:putative pectinesterase/pectinesterase inhibitor 26 n=1 Tax=Populus nigra TaxID=3691 RepID=UPI002B269E63|nr:putative pectinesterase/pectinesterase inhibitor 26 [Populus nigra]
MELNKFILLLLFSSPLLSFVAEAICVPRNVSNHEATGPALSFPSSPPVQAPLPPTDPSPSPSPPVSPTKSISILPSPANNYALKKICGLTDYPAECIANIAPFLTGRTDPISVLKMGMQALHKSFEEATAVATKLNKDPSSSAVVKDSLDTCLESFDSGMSDLNDALVAISSHDIGKLSTMLSATITYPDTCEEAFAERPGLDSPMKEMDRKLTTLASINLAISASLHWS